jgi:hypothetical protein
MILRTLLVIAMVALGLAVAQLQFDRQTARGPALADWVAGPFRGNAQFMAATEALNRQDTDVAVSEARRLVQRRPVPAENLTLLASALYRAGDVEMASIAVQMAAQRGWREPLAQETRLRLALEAGDLTEAGTRYVALLLNPASDNALLKDLGQQVLAEPESDAEAVLIDLVSDTDRWHAVFLRRGPGVMPTAAFGRVITASLARGIVFDCRALKPAIGRVAAQDRDTAETLRGEIGAQCPDLAPK